MKPVGPVAPVRPHVHRQHGVARPDPYDWMRDPDDPAVDAHLDAENAYFEAQVAPLAALTEALYDKMLAQFAPALETPPVPHGPWVYYRRSHPDLPRRLHCRRPRDGGDEQVLIDENALAHDIADGVVGAVQPSPDHQLLAYAVDTSGEERFEIRFLDLRTGEALPSRLPNTSDFEWAADSRTVLWNSRTEHWRPSRVLLHTLGAAQKGSRTSPDPVVFEDPSSDQYVWVETTSSKQFWVIHHGVREGAALYVIPADAPHTQPRCIWPGKPGVRCGVTHTRGSFWIWANDEGASQYRLLRLPDDGSSSPVEVIPHRDDTTLQSVHALRDHLVLTEREAGQTSIRVLDLRTDDSHTVAFPDAQCEPSVVENHDFDGPHVRLRMVSFTTPQTVFRYDCDARSLTPTYERTVEGHDPERYRSERRWLTAGDGAQVPVTLAVRRDVPLTADTPLLLFVYGAYNRPVTPEFIPPSLPLLERGAAFVVAHVRGGGMLGPAWHEAGRLLNKQRTIDDLADVLRGLHASGISRPERTALWAGSGGGIAVGGLANQAPELCRVIHAARPFVAVLDEMLDTELPLTHDEFSEWGDPRQREIFDCMRAYSPYDNVREQAYPDIVAFIARDDPRVLYWGPAKWVARLRANATAGTFLLRCTQGGHHGRSDRHAAMRQSAMVWAWVIDRIGLS